MLIAECNARRTTTVDDFSHNKTVSNCNLTRFQATRPRHSYAYLALQRAASAFFIAPLPSHRRESEAEPGVPRPPDPGELLCPHMTPEPVCFLRTFRVGIVTLGVRPFSPSQSSEGTSCLVKKSRLPVRQSAASDRGFRIRRSGSGQRRSFALGDT